METKKLLVGKSGPPELSITLRTTIHSRLTILPRSPVRAKFHPFQPAQQADTIKRFQRGLPYQNLTVFEKYKRTVATFYIARSVVLILLNIFFILRRFDQQYTPVVGKHSAKL